jgi:hypothetical protein
MNDHEHDWHTLGNLEVCMCGAHRATTVEADAALERLGDPTRLPMKEK